MGQFPVAAKPYYTQVAGMPARCNVQLQANAREHIAAFDVPAETLYGAVATQGTGRTLTMKPRHIYFALGLALTIGLPGVALAQAYKWRDEKGQIVYSDQPPPARIAPGNILRAPKPAPSVVTPAGASATAGVSAKAASSAPKSTAVLEADYKKRQIEAQKKAKEDGEKSAQEQQRVATCTGLKSNLASLESGQRISRTDEKGERSFLSDDERARDIAKARADIAAAKC